MDKPILVFGDSNTYGDGFSDSGSVEPWKQHSQLSWPYHMFPKAQIKNLAYPGCSNDTICLKLVRHASKDNVVLIMFTTPTRIHIIKKGFNFIVSHNGTQAISDNGDENWVAKQIADKDEEKDKRYFVENFDDDFLEIIFLKNISWCQYFCSSKNIECYFTLANTYKKNKMRGSLEKYRDSLYNNINWNNIFLMENTHGFRDYAKKINAKKLQDKIHYDQEYNKLFGNLFLDWINKKNQL